MTNQGNGSALAGRVIQTSVFPAAILALSTLIARLLVHGPLYFSDGTGHVLSIIKRLYVIQPPGYWLFNRTASLFPDPVLAISVMNILFSVAGVVVFYYTALLFTKRLNAFLAALAYSSVFYVWFSGEIHSTFASQIFFPVAIFYAVLRHDRGRSDGWLWLAAILFAVGAGLRPSDGAFMFPMVAFYCLGRLPAMKAVLFLGAVAVLCLGWLIPTTLAYEHLTGRLAYPETGGRLVGVLDYLHGITTSKSVIFEMNSGSMADVLRFVLPLAVAFWAVLPAVILAVVRNRRDWRFQMLLLWIVPGSLFFAFIYISDAPYLNFLSPAVLLLALAAPRRMAITASWNTILFLCFVPILSKSLAVNTFNVYVGKYTRYGIQHQWWPNLSDLQAVTSDTAPTNPNGK